MAYTGENAGARTRRATGARRDGRREERARKREAFVAQNEERLASEIARSVAGVKQIDGMPAVAARPIVPAKKDKDVNPEVAIVEPETEVAQSEVAEAEDVELASEEDTPTEAVEPEADLASVTPRVRVLDQNSVTAILENGRGRAQFCDLAVIDCASFTRPAGGFDAGYMGQEQELCDESYLYSVLKRQRDWYGENRRRNINCELYRNRALVVPAVRFTRGKLHAYADVIVVAAPHAKRARAEYKVAEGALVSAMRDRIRFALAVADSLGHEKLVLSAFGVGQFGWGAETVAEMLREELACGGHVATDVIIAVRKDRFNEDFERFEHAFAAFPAKNETSYEEVKAARAALETADSDDEDEDDDWRKYL